MRTYGRIESGFWQNPKVRALSERGRLLLAYVFSCPHGNAVGCFSLPSGYVMADHNWDSDTANRHLAELGECGFIERDEVSGLMRVVGWWGHNVIENPNVAKAAAKVLALLPAGHEIVRALIEDLETRKSDFREGVYDQLAKGFPKPQPNTFKRKHETLPKGLETKTPNPLETKEPNLTYPNRTEPTQAETQKEPEAVASALREIPLSLVRPPEGDWSQALFRQGLAWLASQTGKTPDQLRSLVGKWLKTAGGDHKRIFDLLANAEVRAIAAPVDWVTASLAGKQQAGVRKLSVAEMVDHRDRLGLDRLPRPEMISKLKAEGLFEQWNFGN